MPDGPLDVKQLLQDDSFLRWTLLDTPEDRAVWQQYLAQHPDQEAELQRVRRQVAVFAAGFAEITRDEDWHRLQQLLDREAPPIIDQPQRRIHRRWAWSAAAIALAVVIGAALFFIKGTRSVTSPSVVSTQSPTDRPPGSNKAILTLSGGQQLTLDSAAIGQLAQQTGAEIQKKANGLLEYVPSATQKKIVQVAYNILSTPRGGQYQLRLPDGSEVWLNAASTIRYPTAFTGGDRRVEIAGQAYFQIAAHPSQPFIVHVKQATGDADITVLSTRFDVEAYGDEPESRTTLIDGAVRYNQGLASKLLHPGDQVRVSNKPAASLNVVAGVDTAAAIAWTTGFFPFEDLDLSAVLRQISRWYDVDIDDRTNESARRRRFGGRISRQLTLMNALRLLESNNIHFRLEGRVLVVLSA